MGKHSIESHRGYRRHMRKRKLMFFANDLFYFCVGLFVGMMLMSLLVILLEGGLNA